MTRPTLYQLHCRLMAALEGERLAKGIAVPVARARVIGLRTALVSRWIEGEDLGPLDLGQGGWY